MENLSKDMCSIVLVRFSKDGIWHVVDNAKKDISFLFNGQNTYKTNFNIHDRFSCLYTDGKSYTAQFFGNFVSIERAYAEIKNYEKLVGKSAEKMTKRKHNDTEGTRKEKQGAPSAAENSVRESIDRLAELTFAQRRHLFSKNKTNADGKVDGSAVPSESLDQQLLPNAISVFQLPVAGINVQSEEAALQQSSRTPTEAPDQIAVLGDMYPDEPDLDFSSPLGVKRKAPAKGVPYRPRPIFSGTLEERVAYLILKAERGKDSRQKNPPPYLVADYHVRFLDQTAPWFFMEDGPKKVQLLSGLPIYADDRLSDLDARYQEGKMSTPKYVWFVMQRLIGGEEGLRRLASLKEKEQHEIELTSMGKGSKFAERTLGAQVFLAVERHVDAVIKSSQRGGVHLVPVAYGNSEGSEQHSAGDGHVPFNVEVKLEGLKTSVAVAQEKLIQLEATLHHNGIGTNHTGGPAKPPKVDNGHCNGKTVRLSGSTVASRIVDAPDGFLCLGNNESPSPYNNFLVFSKFTRDVPNNYRSSSLFFLGTQSVNGGFISFTEFGSWWTTSVAYQSSPDAYTQSGFGDCSNIPDSLKGIVNNATGSLCSRLNPKGPLHFIAGADAVVDDDGAITVLATTSETLWY
ncbi:hypothetical protein BV898_02111 [Hypsibius exemplaris]|uniref:Uncharacterized protein n=1 Tax=Hypsibius exemplaris TaxID=2072580 RepID=A0A1W0XA68_HYPEX|nr:hypothetical protein BV898_02111 [Hypsibius exemplaris]